MRSEESDRTDIRVHLQTLDDTKIVFPDLFAAFLIIHIGSAGARTDRQGDLADIINREAFRLQGGNTLHQGRIDRPPEQDKDDQQFHKHPGIAFALGLDQFEYMFKHGISPFNCL